MRWRLLSPAGSAKTSEARRLLGHAARCRRRLNKTGRFEKYLPFWNLDRIPRSRQSPGPMPNLSGTEKALVGLACPDRAGPPRVPPRLLSYFAPEIGSRKENPL